MAPLPRSVFGCQRYRSPQQPRHSGLLITPLPGSKPRLAGSPILLASIRLFGLKPLVAIGSDLSQGGQGHAEMLGNLGGLHAGQERRSDRLALRLRDLTTTPLRSISRPLWLFQARLDEGGCGLLQCALQLRRGLSPSSAVPSSMQFVNQFAQEHGQLPIREAAQLRKKPGRARRGPNPPEPAADGPLNGSEEIRRRGCKLLLRHRLKMAYLGPHTTAPDGPCTEKHFALTKTRGRPL